MIYTIKDEFGNVIASGSGGPDNFNAGLPDRIEFFPDPVQVEAPKRTLTKLEYMDRFTDQELAAIYTAAKSAVAVEVWLEKFNLATEIELDDPRTVAGLQALETATLLATGRAAEILA